MRNTRFLRINCAILAILFSFSAFGAYTIDPDNTHIARDVDDYVDLTNLLARADIETIILKECITLEDGAVLDGQTTGTKNKTIQVEKPFLPEDGSVRIAGTGDQTYILKPAEGEYVV